jgi:hypothetical protein
LKSVDFQGELTLTGHIMVPPEIAARLPLGERVQVILHWGGADEDEAWRAQGRTRFEAAYADEDAIYEHLIHDSHDR